MDGAADHQAGAKRDPAANTLDCVEKVMPGVSNPRKAGMAFLPDGIFFYERFRFIHARMPSKTSSFL
jgi:hypothetical protein